MSIAMIMTETLLHNATNTVKKNETVLVVKWKETEKRKAFSSRLLIIPSISLDSEVPLREVLEDKIQELQVSIARGFLETTFETAGNDNISEVTIPDELFTVEGIQQWIESKGGTETARLDKKSLEAYLDGTLKDHLELAFITKLSETGDLTPEQQKRVDAAVETHIVVLKKFASPAFKPDLATAKQLQKAVALAPGGSTAKILANRIARVVDAKEVALEDFL